jgi:hypothetical protein
MSNDTIVYSFRPFFTSAEDAKRIRVPAQVFLREWWNIAYAVMKIMVSLSPTLAEDPEFQEIRAEFDAVQVA